MQKRLDKSGVATTVLIAPDVAGYGADTTPAAWDIRQGQQVEIELAIGVGGITFDTNNKIEFELTEADYNETTGAVGSFAAVTDDVYVDGVAVTPDSNGKVKALIAAHAAASVHRIEYVGNKGALKFKANFSGTHGVNTALSAIGRLSHGRNAPAI